MQTKRAECLEDKADYETAAATWSDFEQNGGKPIQEMSSVRSLDCDGYLFRKSKVVYRWEENPLCQYRCRLKEGDNEIYQDIQRFYFTQSVTARKQKCQLSFQGNGSRSGYHQQLACQTEKWYSHVWRRWRSRLPKCKREAKSSSGISEGYSRK